MKCGYGSIEYIKSLDTDDFLNLIEYENIKNDIENHELEKAQKG